MDCQTCLKYFSVFFCIKGRWHLVYYEFFPKLVLSFPFPTSLSELQQLKCYAIHLENVTAIIH